MRSSVFGKMFFYDGANGMTKNDGHIQVEEGLQSSEKITNFLGDRITRRRGRGS
jgi:hypothetical protein